MNKWDRLTLIGISLIMLSAIITIIFFYYNMTNTCISNPLKFAAIKYEELYSYSFSGSGILHIPNPTIASPIFYFDAEGVEIVYINSQNQEQWENINFSDVIID